MVELLQLLLLQLKIGKVRAVDLSILVVHLIVGRTCTVHDLLVVIVSVRCHVWVQLLELGSTDLGRGSLRRSHLLSRVVS